ncbi:MAG: hypothetical protein HRT88_01750 [Lentisphaeraceae bacterium]|nr:hypothetical protein [Lentisphaeraceae bacterium]
MARPFSEQELTKARNGDLKTLAEFDKRGLIAGPGESLEEYCDRLQTFQKNLDEMEDEIKEHGFLTLEDMKFPNDERIPQTAFNPSAKINRELYDFSINWVPGFFLTPRFGMLFGGCAYSFDPDFFSLFIIRNSFKKKKKWLFYERDELMSHELCHVARFAMKSHKYEEQFAYQTSTSGFRKNYGCMMRSAWETYIVMILLFSMLATQISLLTFKSKWMAEQSVISNPVNWFYAALAGFIGFLVLRQKRQNKQFKNCLDLMDKFCKKPRALAFRLSDEELEDISAMKELNKESFIEHLKISRQNTFSLDIIEKRFLQK